MRTAQTKKAARQFVEQYMGANDVAAVIHTSGRTDAAQEFTSNKQLLLTAIDKFVGRRMRSLTLERLDSYYQTLAMRTSEQSSDNSDGNPPSTDPGAHGRTSDPSDFERGFRATGRSRHAEKYVRISRWRPRPSQGRRVLQRRHRLPHHRLVRQSERQRRDSRDSRRRQHGRARQRELLHDRSARAGGDDVGVHGNGGLRRPRTDGRPTRCSRRAQTRRSPASRAARAECSTRTPS